MRAARDTVVNLGDRAARVLAVKDQRALPLRVSPWVCLELSVMLRELSFSGSCREDRNGAYVHLTEVTRHLMLDSDLAFCTSGKQGQMSKGAIEVIRAVFMKTVMYTGKSTLTLL